MLMKDLENLRAAGVARTAPQQAAQAGEIPSSAEEIAQRRAASRSHLHQRLAVGLLYILLGAAATAVALILIVRYPDSGPALFAVQLTGVLGGPTAVLMALIWMFALVRRLRGVRLRAWTAYPARSASLGVGPLRLTVVGIDVTRTTTLVIFPEVLFRRRIRRLVARDGQILVLWPRRGKIFDHLWYAGATGRPIFSDQPAAATGAQRYWERRGLAALNQASERAPRT
jgi:hypothetical protein